MAEWVSYEKALESGAEIAYSRLKSGDSLYDLGQQKWRRVVILGDPEPYRVHLFEFLPIPTAEQLLGAVETEVRELAIGLIVVLEERELKPGDKVIILRTPAPIEPGKVEVSK
jgi:hypothetical protein